MERKQRTNTSISTPPTPQEAAAGLDPLVQSIHDLDDEPIYLHRHSSIFYIPAALTLDETDGNDPERTKCAACQRCLARTERFSGILYALLASFLLTCSNFAYKQFNVVLFDVLIIRFLVQGLISAGFILYKGYSLFSHGNGLLISIRCIFATGGCLSYYLALTLLPLPDLTTIRYTQVVWTAVLALIIFRERINLPTIMASLLTFTGVVCVAQPSFLFRTQRTTPTNETVSVALAANSDSQRSFGMLIALLCALSISISIILNKKLIQRKVRQSIIMLYYLLTTLVALVAIQLHYWLISTARLEHVNFRSAFLTRDFLFASIIGILQLFPMVLSQKAIKREHPSIVTVVQSSDILFAIILQNLFTAFKSDALVLIGSTLVITSIFIVGGHKLWMDRQSRTCVPTCA